MISIYSYFFYDKRSHEFCKRNPVLVELRAIVITLLLTFIGQYVLKVYTTLYYMLEYL